MSVLNERKWRAIWGHIIFSYPSIQRIEEMARLFPPPCTDPLIKKLLLLLMLEFRLNSNSISQEIFKILFSIHFVSDPTLVKMFYSEGLKHSELTSLCLANPVEPKTFLLVVIKFALHSLLQNFADASHSEQVVKQSLEGLAAILSTENLDEKIRSKTLSMFEDLLYVKRKFKMGFPECDYPKLAIAIFSKYDEENDVIFILKNYVSKTWENIQSSFMRALQQSIDSGMEEFNLYEPNQPLSANRVRSDFHDPSQFLFLSTENNSLIENFRKLLNGKKKAASFSCGPSKSQFCSQKRNSVDQGTDFIPLESDLHGDKEENEEENDEEIEIDEFNNYVNGGSRADNCDRDWILDDEKEKHTTYHAHPTSSTLQKEKHGRVLPSFLLNKNSETTNQSEFELRTDSETTAKVQPSNSYRNPIRQPNGNSNESQRNRYKPDLHTNASHTDPTSIPCQFELNSHEAEFERRAHFLSPSSDFVVRKMKESSDALLKLGVDPLPEALEKAKQIGVEFQWMKRKQEGRMEYGVRNIEGETGEQEFSRKIQGNETEQEVKRRKREKRSSIFVCSPDLRFRVKEEKDREYEFLIPSMDFDTEGECLKGDEIRTEGENRNDVDNGYDEARNNFHSLGDSVHGNENVNRYEQSCENGVTLGRNIPGKMDACYKSNKVGEENCFEDWHPEAHGDYKTRDANASIKEKYAKDLRNENWENGNDNVKYLNENACESEQARELYRRKGKRKVSHDDDDDDDVDDAADDDDDDAADADYVCGDFRRKRHRNHGNKEKAEEDNTRKENDTNCPRKNGSNLHQGSNKQRGKKQQNFFDRRDSAVKLEWSDEIDSQTSLPSQVKNTMNVGDRIKLSPFKMSQEISPLIDKQIVLKNIKSPRRHKKLPWTNEEIVALKSGYDKYKNRTQKWRLILNESPKILRNRSTVDLKDKWRNLEKHRMNSKE